MQVKRGPATHSRVSGAQNRCDHAKGRRFIKMERIRPRRDIHLVGDGKNGLETNAFLACT